MRHPLLGGLLGGGGGLGNLAQDTPLDIGAQVFAANDAFGLALNDNAALGWDLTLASAPLAGRRHGHTGERGELSDATYQFTCSINRVHLANDKALPKKKKGIASIFSNGNS